MAHFFYTRTETVRKLDEKGNPIPTKEDPKKFETEEKKFKDSFNLKKVIRTHALSETQIVVLLDDGHDVTEKVPTLKNPKMPPTTPGNIIHEKKTSWVQSEILVEGDEIELLHKALEKEK